MTCYAYTDADDFVMMQNGTPDPEDMVGPPTEPLNTEYSVHVIREKMMNSSAPSPAHRLKLVDGVPTWLDERNVADVVALSILEVDTIADNARARVVGDPVRVKEYERAQQHAEAYRDAGFTGTVPPSVSSWADAKGWTPEEAAKDILAASARWLGALDYIRALRLKAKEDIRKSTTNAEADTLLATFKATLIAAMQGVQ